MGIRIPFCRATVTALTAAWQRARRRGARRVPARVTALSLLADQQPVSAAAERVGRGRSPSYGRPRACLAGRCAGLAYRPSPGRPARLTGAQKRQLPALVAAGPPVAGPAAGCWNGAIGQGRIARESGVLSGVPWVAEPLGTLGFSYQQPRLSSAPLDEARREHWRAVEGPARRRAARRQGAAPPFGDAAGCAPWGALGYARALRGAQPLVRTGGTRKGDKVFGLIASFSGRLFARGHDGRCTAASYCAVLATVLAATARPPVRAQDGARPHTARATRDFRAAHAARLPVHQLPSCPPAHNPVEHPWRDTKRQNTHSRSCPACATLTEAGDTARAHFRAQPAEGQQLTGTYLDQMAALAQVEPPLDALALAAQSRSFSERL